MVRPESNRLLGDFKKVSKLGIGSEPEKLFRLRFGHVHAAQSSPLDFCSSSTPAEESHSLPGMSTMAERLHGLLDARQMTPMELVRAMHVTKATVYFILDGTTGAEKVRAKTILDMSKLLRTTPDYLLYGKGPRDLGVIDAKMTELIGFYEDATDATRDALLGVAKALAQARH